jgi:hypothetical protein
MLAVQAPSSAAGRRVPKLTLAIHLPRQSRLIACYQGEHAPVDRRVTLGRSEPKDSAPTAHSQHGWITESIDMGLFGSRTIACPACSQELSKGENKIVHWMSHVSQLTAGSKAGSYIFNCACGPSDLCWDDNFKAAAGMSVHMQQKHQIPM